MTPEKIDITDNEKHLRNAVPPWETKWLDYGQELIKNSPGLLNDTAKSLLSLVSGVLAIYTGAIALVGIDNKTFPFPWNLSLLIPFLLFITSIYYSVLVLNPRLLHFKPDDIDSIRDSYKNSGDYKYTILKCSLYLFFIAMASIAIIMIFSPVIASLTAKTTMVQFFVPPENQTAFKNLGFTVNESTNMTGLVVLKDDTGSFYSVILNNTTVVFDKNKVIGAIYTKV
ncbi:MAG TPA: hypothetical protein VMC84_01420 [Methanocella sp.]|uniref:hypothetical protein n=1 Tax=Methanocella sp. TaxID=2052833 RepID=UPI002B585499|nr:hypothetical protein [Methanocella sp.]HTY89813.1 hypothetical protein [Methanocella sp.]